MAFFISTFLLQVGPQEEQATDETYEQFEERVLNKRAAVMYRLCKSRMERSPSGDLYLSELTVRNNKKAVSLRVKFIFKKFENSPKKNQNLGSTLIFLI